MTPLPHSCRFCGRYGPVAASSVAEPWDRQITSSRSAVVVPTKGAMVEGWLLVIPRNHALCSAGIGGASLAEFASIVEAAAQMVAKVYGSATLFEHGPASTGTAFGCGIDHAHV